VDECKPLVVGQTEEEWDAEEEEEYPFHGGGEEEGAQLASHVVGSAPPAKKAKARRCRLTVSGTTPNIYFSNLLV
jgi:hypothetical protein